MVPRSVRNANPGNLQHVGVGPDDWAGLMPRAQMSAAQLAEPRFCVFVSPIMGFRALALDMHTSWSNGRKTVRDLISHFAPPNENPTESYITAVCNKMQVASFLPLNLGDPDELERLCQAIATIESGGWDNLWRTEDLVEGVRLALNGHVPAELIA